MSEPEPDADMKLRIKRYLEMRAYTIRYLKMLEDELVAMGGLRPEERACLSRRERRALARPLGVAEEIGV